MHKMSSQVPNLIKYGILKKIKMKTLQPENLSVLEEVFEEIVILLVFKIFPRFSNWHLIGAQDILLND